AAEHWGARLATMYATSATAVGVEFVQDQLTKLSEQGDEQLRLMRRMVDALERIAARQDLVQEPQDVGTSERGHMTRITSGTEQPDVGLSYTAAAGGADHPPCLEVPTMTAPTAPVLLCTQRIEIPTMNAEF